MRATTTTFLRRTFVLLGAALALATGPQVMAQGKLTLTGSQSATCDYSEMKVLPNGNISVTCGGTVVNNPLAANFVLSHPSLSTNYVLAPLTASSATVTRNGGPVEALMVTFSVSGTGCSSGSGGIMLNPGQSQTIAFSVGAAGTSCLVTIGPPSGGGHTASPSSITFTAQGTTQPPPVGDCPAIPSTSVAGNTAINDFSSVDNRRSSSPGSGSILYYPVPPSNTASVKVTFDQGQTGASPAGLTEFQVSPCPGVWNPSGHAIASQCRYGPSDTPNNVFTIWTAAATSAQGTLVQGQGDLQYLCYAPVVTRTYYINVRHTYTCPAELVSGYGGCGHSMKWKSNNSNGLFD